NNNNNKHVVKVIKN
ncbi:hypothetical protein, partial [Flavobacterium gelidilacus]